MILDQQQKNMMRLIERDKHPNGWSLVSDELIEMLVKMMPAELVVFKTDESKHYVRLTDEGKTVYKWT